MNLKSKFFYTIIINGLIVACAFGSSMMMTNIFGPEGFGKYKFMIVVAATMTMFSNYGLPEMLNVKLATKAILLKDYIVSVLIGVMPVYLIIGGLIFNYFLQKENFIESSLILIGLLYCLLYQLNSIFQQAIYALDKVVLCQLFELIKQGLFIFCSLILYFFHLLSLKNIFSILVIANAIAVFYVLYLAFKTNITEKIKLAFDKELIKNSFRAYMNGILNFLTTRADLFLLSFNSIGFYDIGLYTLATTLMEKLWIIPDSIRSVLFLEISNRRKDEIFVAQLLRIIVFLLFISGIIIALGSRYFIPKIFGEEFIGSVMPFLILLPGTIIVSMFRVLGAYFVAKEMIIINTKACFIFSLLNVGLNIILIPHYTLLGAAMAKTIAFALGTIYHVEQFKKISQLSFLDLVKPRQEDLVLLENLIWRKSINKNSV